MSDTIQKIIDAITDKVKFAFIFGSINTKYFNSKSDIDIAVWLEKETISINEVVI